MVRAAYVQCLSQGHVQIVRWSSMLPLFLFPLQHGGLLCGPPPTCPVLAFPFGCSLCTGMLRLLFYVRLAVHSAQWGNPLAPAWPSAWMLHFCPMTVAFTLHARSCIFAEKTSLSSELPPDTYCYLNRPLLSPSPADTLCCLLFAFLLLVCIDSPNTSGEEDYRWAILKRNMSAWQWQLFSIFFIAIAQIILLGITGVCSFHLLTLTFVLLKPLEKISTLERSTACIAPNS